MGEYRGLATKLPTAVNNLELTQPTVLAGILVLRRYTATPNIGLSDTAIMDMMISNLQQQRRVTEQLRREAAIKRIAVSQAVQDMIKYILDHERDDCLIVGFSSQKANPFREKSSCNIL